jgi:cellobiose PTS system EIIA component
MEYEQIIMQLIVNAGNAKSKAMESIQLAKTGNIVGARTLYEQAGNDLSKAHEIQTKLIQEEADGKAEEISLLMVHAQDHLMNAITVRDLSQEFIDMYEKILNHSQDRD